MAYTDKLAADLKQYQEQVLTGTSPGISSGFNLLDKTIGKIEPSHIWLIGGKSGVGKTFFLQNLANNYVQNGARVIIFSTELTVKSYAIRHGMMLGGVYKLQFENNPTRYKQQVSDGFMEYLSLTNRLAVCSVSSLEQIVELTSKKKPDLIMIDYVQELSVGDEYSKKDTMPLIGAKLKEFAMSSGIPMVVASQVKNGVLDADAYTTNQTPYDFAKELNNAAHNAIWIQRKKNEDGTLEPILTALITKARDGELGGISFDILPGYQLREQ